MEVSGIVTVNDYLIQRDSVWMGQIFKFLVCRLVVLTSEVGDNDRKLIYRFDIVAEQIMNLHLTT